MYLFSTDFLLIQVGRLSVQLIECSSCKLGRRFQHDNGCTYVYVIVILEEGQ